MKDIATFNPHQAHPLSVEKDEPQMGEKAEGILKSPPTSPRSFCNPFHLSEISGEEGDNLI
jgi:hypothetical protein